MNIKNFVLKTAQKAFSKALQQSLNLNHQRLNPQYRKMFRSGVDISKASIQIYKLSRSSDI